MALVNYSSSSDDDIEDSGQPATKVIKLNIDKKLPLPSAIKSMNRTFNAAPIDDPTKHQGRIRSFQHERGNWTTLIFIPVDLNIIDELQTIIKNTLKIDLKQSENIHLSLTKTVILRHHWIKLFTKSLEESLASVEHHSTFT